MAKIILGEVHSPYRKQYVTVLLSGTTCLNSCVNASTGNWWTCYLMVGGEWYLHLLTASPSVAMIVFDG